MSYYATRRFQIYHQTAAAWPVVVKIVGEWDEVHSEMLMKMSKCLYYFRNALLFSFTIIQKRNILLTLYPCEQVYGTAQNTYFSRCASPWKPTATVYQHHVHRVHQRIRRLVRESQSHELIARLRFKFHAEMCQLSTCRSLILCTDFPRSTATRYPR